MWFVLVFEFYQSMNSIFWFAVWLSGIDKIVRLSKHSYFQVQSNHGVINSMVISSIKGLSKIQWTNENDRCKRVVTSRARYNWSVAEQVKIVGRKPIDKLSWRMIDLGGIQSKVVLIFPVYLIKFTKLLEWISASHMRRLGVFSY